MVVLGGGGANGRTAGQCHLYHINATPSQALSAAGQSHAATNPLHGREPAALHSCEEEEQPGDGERSGLYLELDGRLLQRDEERQREPDRRTELLEELVQHERDPALCAPRPQAT